MPIQRPAHRQSLNTCNPDEAEVICRDVAEILEDELLGNDPDSPRLLAYHPRAVSIVHGKTALAALDSKREKPVLDMSDVGLLGKRIADSLRRVSPLRWQEVVDKALTGFESRRYAELQDEYQKLEQKLKVACLAFVKPKLLCRRSRRHAELCQTNREQTHPDFAEPTPLTPQH